MLKKRKGRISNNLNWKRGILFTGLFVIISVYLITIISSDAPLFTTQQELFRKMRNASKDDQDRLFEAWRESEAARIAKTIWGNKKWNSTRPIIVNMFDSIANHNGALKLINLRNLDKTCHDFNILPGNCDWVEIPNCKVPCVFTANPLFFSIADIVFFHVDQWEEDPSHIPKSKFGKQKWAIFGHEPIWKRRTVWMNPNILRTFDLAFHWAYGADVPLTFFYLDEMHYLHNPGEWWHLHSSEKWKYALNKYQNGKPNIPLMSVMVSDCKSNARNLFLQQIFDLLPIASLGKCFNTAKGDRRKIINMDVADTFKDLKWRDQSALLMEQKIEMIKEYPFHLAIESTRLERGFITEKIFQCFVAGVIPVYYGHPETKRFLPPNSVIYVGDYQSIGDLANDIQRIAGNTTLYMSYHQWRALPNVTDYFSRFVNHSRISSPCRLCTEAQRVSGKENSPHYLSFHPTIGWHRQYQNSSLYRIHRNFTKIELQDRVDLYLEGMVKSDVAKLELDTLYSYLEESKNRIVLEDSEPMEDKETDKEGDAARKN